MSHIKQSEMPERARNSSADENKRTVYPAETRRSPREFKTRGSSSRTATMVFAGAIQHPSRGGGRTCAHSGAGNRRMDAGEWGRGMELNHPIRLCRPSLFVSGSAPSLRTIGNHGCNDRICNHLCSLHSAGHEPPAAILPAPPQSFPSPRRESLTQELGGSLLVEKAYAAIRDLHLPPE